MYVLLLCDRVFIDLVDVLSVIKPVCLWWCSIRFILLLFYWIIVFYLVGNNCLFKCIYTKSSIISVPIWCIRLYLITVTIKDEKKKLWFVISLFLCLCYFLLLSYKRPSQPLYLNFLNLYSLLRVTDIVSQPYATGNVTMRAYLILCGIQTNK
jgi:hypothetical protein